MSKNIFENAKFGDAFKTRDGRKAIFLGLRNAERRALMLYNISTTDWYIGDKKDVDICTGMVYSSLKTTSDIIGKWNEPISGKELEELAKKLCPNWWAVSDRPNTLKYQEALTWIKTFKIAYRKAEEKLL